MNGISLRMAAVLVGGMISGSAMAGDTCAYVMGQTNGRTFTTPAVVYTVPDSDALIEATRVHVDPTSQTILGYTVDLPGVDEGLPETGVFVPGYTIDIPSYALSIPALGLDSATCVSFGITTPAVPIYVPESQLEVPGFFADTPSIVLNILGLRQTMPGKFFSYDGNTILIPSYSKSVPSLNLTSPDMSVSVKINSAVQSARYLMPLF